MRVSPLGVEAPFRYLDTKPKSARPAAPPQSAGQLASPYSIQPPPVMKPPEGSYTTTYRCSSTSDAASGSVSVTVALTVYPPAAPEVQTPAAAGARLPQSIAVGCVSSPGSVNVTPIAATALLDTRGIGPAGAVIPVIEGATLPTFTMTLA